MELLRYLYIFYMSRYYDDNDMYSLIAQSDQNNAIIRGDYDDEIIKLLTD